MLTVYSVSTAQKTSKSGSHETSKKAVSLIDSLLKIEDCEQFHKIVVKKKKKQFSIFPHIEKLSFI